MWLDDVVSKPRLLERRSLSDGAVGSSMPAPPVTWVRSSEVSEVKVDMSCSSCTVRAVDEVLGIAGFECGSYISRVTDADAGVHRGMRSVG